MLSEKEMRIIARDACVEMLGKDLVYQHKDLCCSAYGIYDDGLFYYSLGMDTKEFVDWQLGGETPMQYYAFVVVDPKTGKATRDYHNSTLPN